MPPSRSADRAVGAVWRSEYFRFLAVGAFLTIVDAAIFTLLTLIGMPAAISAIPSRIAGAAIGYVLNRKFTFRRAAATKVRTSMVRYWSSFVVFTVVAMFGAQALVLIQPAGVISGVWLPGGWIVIEGSLFVLAFLVQRHWVFAP